MQGTSRKEGMKNSRKPKNEEWSNGQKKGSKLNKRDKKNAKRETFQLDY